MSSQGEQTLSLRECEEGAVYTEYLIVLVVVSLVATGMIVGLGLPLFNYFSDVSGIVVSPVP